MQKQIASAWAVAGTAVAVAVVVVTGSTVGLFGTGGDAAAQGSGTAVTTTLVAPVGAPTQLAPASGLTFGSAPLTVPEAGAPVEAAPVQYQEREHEEREHEEREHEEREHEEREHEEREHEERERGSILTRFFRSHDD